VIMLILSRQDVHAARQTEETDAFEENVILCLVGPP
jgi:hypothetical protein